MKEQYWKKALDFEDIIYEKSAEGIAKITINRPEVRNAFRPLTVKEMQQALEDAREDYHKRESHVGRSSEERGVIGCLAALHVAYDQSV